MYSDLQQRELDQQNVLNIFVKESTVLQHQTWFSQYFHPVHVYQDEDAGAIKYPGQTLTVAQLDMSMCQK